MMVCRPPFIVFPYQDFILNTFCIFNQATLQLHCSREDFPSNKDGLFTHFLWPTSGFLFQQARAPRMKEISVSGFITVADLTSGSPELARFPSEDHSTVLLSSVEVINPFLWASCRPLPFSHPLSQKVPVRNNALTLKHRG